MRAAQKISTCSPLAEVERNGVSPALVFLHVPLLDFRPEASMVAEFLVLDLVEGDSQGCLSQFALGLLTVNRSGFFVGTFAGSGRDQELGRAAS